MTAARPTPSKRPGSDGPVTLRSLADHLKLSPASVEPEVVVRGSTGPWAPA